MNSAALDRLSRLVTLSETRRALLARGATLPVAAALAAFLWEESEAGRRHRPKTRHHPGTHKSNHKAKGKGKGHDKKKAANQCIAPNGVDLNELYGVSAQIVSGFCPEVGSGERWISVGAPWFVNDTFAVTPKGFEPKEGTTPLQDFQAKFTELKLVIDPGDPREKTVVFPNDGNLFTSPGDLWPDIPAEWVLVSPITLGTVQPLSVGEHVVDVYWVFSDIHCDGVGDSITDNCLPAGEVLYFPAIAFEVTPGHN